jgi:hypothetical protein
VYFLPPYSYDFNHIELAFHDAKYYIRRTHGLSDQPINRHHFLEGLNQVGAAKAVQFFRYCGIVVGAEEEEVALSGLNLLREAT